MRLHADHPRVRALQDRWPGLGTVQAIRHLQAQDTLTNRLRDRRTGSRARAIPR